MNVILSKTGDRRAIFCRTVAQPRILQPANIFFSNVVLQIRSDYSFILMLNPTNTEYCLSKNVDALLKTCIATSEICFVPNADKAVSFSMRL